MTFQGIRVALELANCVATDEEIHAWLRNVDISCKGYVDFSDYQHACNCDLVSRPQSTSIVQSNNLLAIKKLFNQYDRDGDGFISRDDLIAAFNNSSINHEVDETAIISWMRLMESDISGRVSFDVFARRFMHM